MKLDSYLTERNETADAFAKRIARATSTVTRLRKGLTKPDSATMERILEATGGEVTPNDFFQIPERAA